MLIDDLRTINIHYDGKFIRDAIVFRLNERADSFGMAQVMDELEPLPSKLPYNNLVIHFEGSIFAGVTCGNTRRTRRYSGKSRGVFGWARTCEATKPKASSSKITKSIPRKELLNETGVYPNSKH